mmetsp:Transcript_8484/g.16544  ORF Transcript_8484/g.16544 Transcript_8484/m.16544 type:complete len:393 (+) Transcript_8484:226-1404(+)
MSDEALFDRKDYSNKEFWDQRFQENTQPFDWYCGFTELKPFLFEHCAPSNDPVVLVLGCGNSKLSTELKGAGFRTLMNSDFSPVVLNQMREKTPHCDPALEWGCMDVTRLPVRGCSVDLVVDKGTLDAVACTGSDDAPRRLFAECLRVLRPQGFFFLVTHTGWEGRRKFSTIEGDAEEEAGVVWEVVVSQRVGLNDMSTLINILRSRLGRRPLSSAFKAENVETLKAAVEEYREVVSKRRISRLLVSLKSRLREKKEKEKGGETGVDPSSLEGKMGRESVDSSDRPNSNLAGQRASSEENLTGTAQAADNVVEEAKVTVSKEQESSRMASDVVVSGDPPVLKREKEEGEQKNLDSISEAEEAKEREDSQEGKPPLFCPRRQQHCFLIILRKI